MPVVSQKWKRTKDSYLRWLLSTKLKDIFSKNIYYENLSLWWLTRVYEKDALNDNQWFNNLNEKINGINNIEFRKKTNIFFDICKTLFKFLKTIVILFFIKILYQDNKSRNNIKKNRSKIEMS